MKKISVTIVVLAALLPGCSNDIPATNEPDTDLPICLTSSSLTVTAENRAATRAPYMGIIGNPNLSLKAIVVTTSSNTDFTQFYSTASLSSTMTWTIQDDDIAANNSTNAKPHDLTVYFYPTNPAIPVYLSGLYPITGWTASGTTGFQQAINGSTDIMTAPTVTTTKVDATSTPTSFKKLAFTHALTLLNIYVKAADTDAITAWGKVTDLSITKALAGSPQTTCTVTFPAGTTAFSTPGSINAYQYSGIYTDTPFTGRTQDLTTTEAKVAYSIVSPITSAAGNPAGGYSIFVKTANHTTGVEVPITLSTSGDTTGKAYDITLTFKGQLIKATATVTDWATGGTGTGTLE